MKVHLVIDHKDFNKLEEIANEYRYQNGYEFLAQATDNLRDHLSTIGKLIRKPGSYPQGEPL